LFFAGARSVLLSLWPVPDDATCDLMVALYAALHRGLPPGDALRTAKLLLRDRDYDPQAWAGFVILGRAW
jgi:CHAT domain-containing protein